MKSLINQIKEAKKELFKSIVNLPFDHQHRAALNDYVMSVDSLLNSIDFKKLAEVREVNEESVKLLVDFSNFIRCINPQASVVLKIVNIEVNKTTISNVLLSNPHLFKQTLTDFLLLQHADNAALL